MNFQDYIQVGVNVVTYGVKAIKTVQSKIKHPQYNIVVENESEKKIKLDPLLTIFSLGCLYLNLDGSKVRIEKAHLVIDPPNFLQGYNRIYANVNELFQVCASVKEFTEVYKNDPNANLKTAAKAACKGLKCLIRTYTNQIQTMTNMEQLYKIYCDKMEEAVDLLKEFATPQKSSDNLEQPKENENGPNNENNNEIVVENRFSSPNQEPTVHVKNLVSAPKLATICSFLEEGMKAREEHKVFIEFGLKATKKVTKLNLTYDKLLNI